MTVCTNMGLTLPLAILCIPFVTHAAKCPAGFDYYYHNGRPTFFVPKPYEASCYMFTSEATTWIDAKRRCWALGGDLVTIETAGEEHHLDYLIRHVHKRKHSGVGYWTSATDEAKEGMWKWTATGRFISCYSNWAPHEPNQFGGNENCMHLNVVTDYKWNDIKCTEKMSYICERRA